MNTAKLSHQSQVRQDVFLSGQSVPAGVYRNLFSGREILQPNNRPLPRATDGTATVYVRLDRSRAFSFTKSTGIVSQI